MAIMKTIYLVRHGHTVVADDRIVAGFSDVALSERGTNSLARLKNTIGSIEFDAYYSSDLLRTQQSMKLLTDNRFITDPRLKELNFGDWEGMSWNDVHENHPEQISEWSNNWVDKRPPNGETFKELSARCKDWLTEQLTTPDQTILVTAHGGSIRALLCESIGLPLSVAMRFDIDHASVTKLILDDKNNRCVFVNSTQFDSAIGQTTKPT